MDPRTASSYGPGDRWEYIWSHREELLQVARSRSMSPEDAEDAVQEAMLSAIKNQGVRYDRMGAWLRAVTVRLCVARQRQVVREAELSRRPVLAPVEPVPVEEAECDRAEARWLVDRGMELPARQAEVLRLKSQDLDVQEVARKMGLSYQAAESLLARARRTMRDVLARSLALGVTVWLWVRRSPYADAVQSAAATSTAMTLTVVGLALPAGSSSQPDGPRPAAVVARGGPEPEHPVTRGSREAAGRAVSAVPHRTGKPAEVAPAPEAGDPPGGPVLTVLPGASVSVRTSAVTPLSMPSLPPNDFASPALSTATAWSGKTALVPEAPSALSAGVSVAPRTVELLP